jgi:site-specific recombinase XerC
MANYADGARTPRTLTEREQRALLKVTGEHRAGFRDHVLYPMALGTGLREHELIGLDVGDVFRDGRPKRRLLLSVFKGAGKAGGTQEVLLSESLRGKLRRFWDWKARERECLDDEAPLFISRLGRRLTQRFARHRSLVTTMVYRRPCTSPDGPRSQSGPGTRGQSAAASER